MSHVTNSKPLVILAGSPIHELQSAVQRWGYRVQLAATEAELFEQLAKAAARAAAARIVVLHAPLAGASGLAVYRKLRDAGQRSAVVMLSADRSIETAVQAMKLGACDYMAMPVELSRLGRALQLAAEQYAAGDDLSDYEEPPRKNRLVGQSDAIRLVQEIIEEVAPTEANVLILGESGTGKELVARELHEKSRRASGPFVPVNMAAIPEGVAESILFGHEKGSFTGADKARLGVCEQADQGTLFLDEIGEMDMLLQAKLLRFVQEQTFQRVGSESQQRVEVRIVSATNLSPSQMLEQNNFREDLFYRLNVVPIRVPPLRDRPDDIPVLADHFLALAALRNNKQVDGFSPAAVEMMRGYDWPGNVRQLENVVQRLVIFSRERVINDTLLRIEIADEMPGLNGNGHRLMSPHRGPQTQLAALKTDEDDLSWSESTEKRLILQALKKTGGNVVQAAKLLGLGQATVYRKIKRYRIPRPQDRATK